MFAKCMSRVVSELTLAASSNAIRGVVFDAARRSVAEMQ